MSGPMKDIAGLLPTLPGPVQSAARPQPAGADFAEFLGQMVDKVEASQAGADQAVQDLNSGKAQNLHEVMVSMEQADISMRLMVQVRNKVVEAYQEIMRMQV